MNLNKIKLCFISALCCPMLASADVAMELEMACVGDIELSNAVIEIIQNGSTDKGEVTADEVLQVQAVLGGDGVSGLDAQAKFMTVMRACFDGVIFQERHADIIGSQ